VGVDTAATLTITNAGDRPVYLSSVSVIELQTWQTTRPAEQLEPTRRLFDLPRRVLQPRGDALELPLPAGWDVATNEYGNRFAVVEYLDPRQTTWQRRSDSGELRQLFPSDQGNRLQQAMAHFLDRNHRLDTMVVGFPASLARRAARRSPDRIPLSVRWVELIRGRWPELNDAWEAPDGAPALWRYRGLGVGP
jgi:hypothetical protein